MFGIIILTAFVGVFALLTAAHLIIGEGRDHD